MYSHSRDEGFGAEVKRRILLGTYALSAGYYDAYYLKAQQVRRLLAEEFLRAFAEVDAIVTPTAPTPAFKLGEKTGDPLAMYLADIYTVTASLAGICGVTVPCGATSAGLPVGMQVLASAFDEGTAFRVARAVEAAQKLGSKELNRHACSRKFAVRSLDCLFLLFESVLSATLDAAARKASRRAPGRGRSACLIESRRPGRRLSRRGLAQNPPAARRWRLSRNGPRATRTT